MLSSSPYLDRLLRAAMKRRCVDSLALSALMKATHLLGLALGERLRQCRHSGDPGLARFARIEEQALHVALLDEALQILGSRWDKVPERQRPHYTPAARFRILRARRRAEPPPTPIAPLHRDSKRARISARSRSSSLIYGVYQIGEV